MLLIIYLRWVLFARFAFMRRMFVVGFALAAFAVSAIAFAQMYRWVDEKGRVQYSDKPPPANMKGQRVIPLPPKQEVPSTVSEKDKSKSTVPVKKEQRGYASLKILSPASEETISNTNVVVVQLALEPALDQANGHKIRVTLDGAPAGLWDGPQGSLSNVIRGEHALGAEVIDAKGVTILGTNAVKFYVQQASVPPPGGKKK